MDDITSDVKSFSMPKMAVRVWWITLSIMDAFVNGIDRITNAMDDIRNVMDDLKCVLGGVLSAKDGNTSIMDVLMESWMTAEAVRIL